MILRVEGDNARRLTLAVDSSTAWGDMQLRLELSLGWADAIVKGTCDPERLAELNRGLETFVEGAGNPVEFISTEGNIDLSIRATSTGKVSISGDAIPDMTQDERIRFEIVGVLKRDVP